MSHEAISELIGQLQKTLERGGAISEKDREHLRDLSADLQAMLAEPGGATHEKHQGLIDRLRDAVTRFEASHPDLTATMAQVSKTLADMGI